MATSTRTFLIELYEEYLEEASFLYEQRLSLLQNPEISWKKIGEFEERLEAHIDGLVVGGELGIDVCKRRAEEGGFGELHAALRVFCRQNRKELVQAILKELDFEDAEKVRAARDALKYELPPAWHHDFWSLAETNASLVPILLTVLGYRRADIAKDLRRILLEAPASWLRDVIWACGRLRNADISPALRLHLEPEDAAVQEAAAIALLRSGDRTAFEHSERSLTRNCWSFIPLGLAGSRRTVEQLLNVAHKHEENNDLLIALGLLGDVSAVPTLLSRLANPKVASSAAVALQLIGGAGLFETVFIPEQMDEDELFEEEREEMKAGQAQAPPGGKLFGTTITRLSQKVEDWQHWWAENESTFNRQLYYRSGKPCSPECLLEGLKSEWVPHSIRNLAYEELVIRYGMDVPFEADMFVTEQQKALEEIALWVEANGVRFQEGAWYFGGSPAFS
jgi:uncharacterized protein (TIGR02270 family)